MPLPKTQFNVHTQDYSTGVGVSSFASVLHFTPPEASSKGRLVVTAVVHSPDARIGKEIYSQIEQKYYANDGKSVFDSLTTCLGDIVHQLRQRQIEIELGGVAISDNVSYLVSANGACSYLIRDGAASLVLESEEAEFKSASGYIEEGDIFLASSQGLFEIINLDRLDVLLDEVNDIEELKNALVDETLGNKKPIVFSIVQLTETVVAEQIIESELVSTTNTFSPSPKSSGKIRTKIASVLDSIIKIIPERRVLIKDDISIDGKPQKSKLPVVVGVVLLMLLSVSIWYGAKTRSEQIKKAEYQDELQSAKHQFEEARSLSQINAPRAKELILSAKNTVTELENKGIEDQDVKVLGEAIEQNLGGIAGIYTGSPDVFLDLSLIRADFKANDLSYSEEVIRVLDGENKRMSLINSESKKTENIGNLDLLPNARAAASYGNESYILSSDGIREVQKELELVVKSEDWSGGDVLIGAFGGNLYALDKNENLIWRYPRGVNSYGSGQEWFAPGINVNVSDAISWAIDGKVWILKEGGVVLVYERGLPQRFVIEGVDNKDGFKQIFTDESSEFVYLLDSSKSRVVVLEKTGAYKGEYQVAELSSAVDFVVSEPSKKIIFLTDNKLLEIPLKH